MVKVLTSGLPKVCKLWLGVNKGMLPVKHLAPKILMIMEINYCGRQLAQRLGWAASAYHKGKVQSSILERTSLACSMKGVLMGVRVERGEGRVLGC